MLLRWCVRWWRVQHVLAPPTTYRHTLPPLFIVTKFGGCNRERYLSIYMNLSCKETFSSMGQRIHRRFGQHYQPEPNVFHPRIVSLNGDRPKPRRSRRSRGGQRDLPSTHDRFVLPSEYDHSRSEFAAGVSRPGRKSPASQRHGGHSLVRESFETLGEHRISRREGGVGLRERCEEAFGEPDAGPSANSTKPPSMQIAGDSLEQEARFVPYTFRMLRQRDIDFLSATFHVRPSRVHEWCERDYIRMDRMRDCETNIDPLLNTLTDEDRRNYARALRGIEMRKEIGEPVGWGPRHVPRDYEHGFDCGQASVRFERGNGGH